MEWYALNCQRFYQLTVALIMVALFAPADASAQCDLGSALQAAHPTQVSSNDLQQQRHTLVAAMNHLNQNLRNSGQTLAEDWRRYLRWTELNDLIQQGERADVAILRTNLELYLQRYPGLERPDFLGVRHALRKYIVVLEVRQATDQMALINGKLDAARALLYGHRLVDLNPEAIDRLGMINAWLIDAEQAALLTACINQHFSHGNVVIGLGINLLRLGLNETFDELTPIRENTFGSYVTGQARTRATTGLTLVPNPHAGDLRAVVTGQTIANTTSSQSRVYVDTTLVSNFNVSKRIGFNGRQFVGYPTIPQVHTSGRINAVRTDRLIGWRLAQRIGWRRAQEALPAGANRTSQRVGQQVSQRLEERANAALNNLNQLYSEFIGEPLARIGFETLAPQSRTTAHALQTTLELARFEQLSAPTPAPAVTGYFDLQGSVHETTAVNFLDEMIGAEKVDDREVESFVETIFGTIPDDLATGVAVDTWDFVFDAEEPVYFTFRDGRINVRVAIDEFTRRSVSADDPPIETYTGTLNVEATYSMQLTSEGILLTRVGDPLVTFDSALSPGLERFARRKVAAILGPTLLVDNITLPENRVLGAARNLDFRYASAAEGWFNVGANLQH